MHEDYSAIDAYEPCELEDGHKEELQNLMATCNVVIKKAAEKNYGSGGIKKIQQLRYDFHNGKKIKINRAERNALEQLRGIEQIVLRGWIKVSSKLCRAFFFAEKKAGVSISDLYQEAAIVIVNCIYAYSGKHQFSSLVYSSVKNRLIDLCRLESKCYGITRDDVIARAEIKLTMDMHQVDFDSAVALLNIDDSVIGKLRDSMFSVKNESQMFNQYSRTDYTEIASHSSKPVDDLSQMRDAIDNTVLSAFERDLIETYLIEGHGSQTIVSQRHINKVTRKPYSRCRAYQVFHEVCRKVQDTYMEYERKVKIKAA